MLCIQAELATRYLLFVYIRPLATYLVHYHTHYPISRHGMRGTRTPPVDTISFNLIGRRLPQLSTSDIIRCITKVKDGLG